MHYHPGGSCTMNMERFVCVCFGTPCLCYKGKSFNSSRFPYSTHGGCRPGEHLNDFLLTVPRALRTGDHKKWGPCLQEDPLTYTEAWCCLGSPGREIPQTMPQFSRIRFCFSVMVKLVGHQGGTQAGRRAGCSGGWWRLCVCQASTALCDNFHCLWCVIRLPTDLKGFRLSVKDTEVVLPICIHPPSYVIAMWLRTRPCSRNEFWLV